MAARRPDVRIGRQRPTFERVGEYETSDGDKIVALFGQYGISFYGSQEYEIGLFAARDAHGRFASRSIAISKPRQNGKSYGVRFYALHAACCRGLNVLYTCHHGKTTRKMFKYMREFCKSNPDWMAELLPGAAGISNAEGREALYFRGGGMIEFATRTNSAARGETYDIIIFDEAQELTDEQAEAINSTVIASDSGDPQKIYVGTPPGPKCPGTVFRSLHDKAHAGTGGSVWWLEWAAEKLGDTHDKDLWYATNPALGLRINEDVFEDAADSATSVDGFFRENLGWWSVTTTTLDPAIDVDSWTSCAIGKPPKDGVLSAGIKFSLDGKIAALSVCLNPKDAPPHVETICVKSTVRGVRWLVDWCVERKAKLAQITIDGKAKAVTLQKKLLAQKLPKRQVVVCSTADITNACAMFEEAVSSSAITHFAQPGLDESVESSPRRAIGKAGGWAFDGELSLAVESAGLAHYGAMTTKRVPGRKVKML